MPNLNLRDYQIECLNTVIEKAKKGVTRQVIVLATGLGKTVIMSQLPPRVRDKGKKTLLLAHREELLTQARDKFLWADSTLKIGIEKGEQALSEKDIFDSDVIVGSVQTLGRTNSKRIEKFNPKDFGLILIDEAHHAVSQGYLNVLKYFKGLKGEADERRELVVLGVTATPNRSDKAGLGKVFQEITFNYPLRKGIENGYLCNIKAFSVETGTDISQVHTSMGDLAEDELAEAINTEERNKLIVDTYLEIAGGDKALAFAVNVEHGEELTKYFKSRGIPTEAVFGHTDKDVRRKILEDFKEGKILVVVNVGVLTEGFDEPSIQALLMARPTKSSVLFAQMIGRGTRLHPGKEHLKLIDFVDNTGKNELMSLPALFGAASGKKLKATKNPKPITEMLTKLEKIEDLDPNYPVDQIEDWSDENIEKIIKEIDIFALAKPPEEVSKHSQNSWERHGDGGFRIKFPHQEDEVLGKKTYQEIRFEPNMLEQYEVVVDSYIEQNPSFANNFKKWKLDTSNKMYEAPSLESAFRYGDTWIETQKPEMSKMLDQKAKWRGDQPTDKQLSMLKKLGIPVPSTGCTKGQASYLIGLGLSQGRQWKKRK